MINMARSIPIEILREALDYDPETGEICWKVRPSHHFAGSKNRTAEHTAALTNSYLAGRVAGHATDEGYITIMVCGVALLAHRVAFALMMGRWPEDEIDHQNGDKSDNSWTNIRAATRSQNALNLAVRKDNQSGRIGVGFYPRSKKWRARITVNKQTKTLGLFPSFQEACAARTAAEANLGFHKNHGRTAV